MGNYTIVNGKVLTPQGLVEGELHIADGKVAQNGAPDANIVDAKGGYVLPGIIDIHGDGFERICMPRPGVYFPYDIALHETDRQLIANGITTAYHGLTVSWEPGLRSITRTRTLWDKIIENRSSLLCDTRIHMRWETFALNEMEATIEMLKGEQNPILAFNDHTTKACEGTMDPKKITNMAERSGMTILDYRELVNSIWARKGEVDGAIADMAEKAKEHNAILLAHDEISVEQRKWFRDLGAGVSEFPLNLETAKDACANGEHVVLGAPNVVRGGSHTKAVNATDAISQDCCSILASDYYYPSQLHAAFILVEKGVCTLPQAWALISENPAKALNLNDRGTFEPGKRADVIVVSQEKLPQVQRSYVAGKECLSTAV